MFDRRSSMLAALRGGSWLTPDRLARVGVLMLAAAVLTIGVVWLTADGILDQAGRPVGTDFANVYAAGRMVLEGRAAAAWDWPAHHAVQQAVAGRADVPFYGWHYPPMFLAIAAGLALFPYLAALALWQAASFAGYAVAARAIVGGTPLALLLTAAFPAVLVNILHGHNGFLSAALLGGALVLLDKRPVVAGILIGCLAYKPQLGVLIPVALAVSGRWTAFVSAGVTVVATALAAHVAWPDAWAAFLASLEPTRTIVLEAGDTGFHKMQSLFAALRMWGVPAAAAHAAQGALLIACALAVAWLWRSPADMALKAAGLTLASLLATPYAMDYDLAIAGIAIAFLVDHGRRTGFAPWEASALALLWAAPILTRQVAGLVGLPLGLIALLLMLALVLRRAMPRPSAATALASP